MKSTQDEPSYPFFVYGTLLPGQPNAFLWQGVNVLVVRAVFPNGRLYDMGGYPMMVEGGGETVRGVMITIPDGRYADVLSRLDALEGYDPASPDDPGYRRRLREVKLADGPPISVWTFMGQANLVNGRPLVENGDWASYIDDDLTRIRDWRAETASVYGLHELIKYKYEE